MEDVEIGRIHPYRPCILPAYREKGFEVALIKSSIEHLRKCGAKKVRFSIKGSINEVMPYVDLYRNLGFYIWREAQIMKRNLDDIPDLKPLIPLKLLTSRQIGVDAFVNFFIECFKDSKDRDASKIASDVQKVKLFIRRLLEREGEHHDPDCWMAAFAEEKFVGFAIATCREGYGLVAEVGVVPQFRRLGVGTFLTLKALQRLKERGAKEAFLGVDLQNMEAVLLYEKLGFKRNTSGFLYELEMTL